MEHKDIDNILNKIEQLRSIFIITESIFPFIEDLLIFVKEIRPLLTNLTSSIEDSTKKNTKASAQLDKVTEATEMATTEILNKLDHLLPELDSCQDNCGTIKKADEKRKTDAAAINSFIKKNRKELAKMNGGNEFLEAVSGFDGEQSIIDAVDKIDQSIEQIRFDGYDIMNALQVQDITAQQLASANKLLESVKNKLAQLLSKFTDEDFIPEHKFHRAHDADAEYGNRESRQNLADEIAQQIQKKG